MQKMLCKIYSDTHCQRKGTAVQQGCASTKARTKSMNTKKHPQYTRLPSKALSKKRVHDFVWKCRSFGHGTCGISTWLTTGTSMTFSTVSFTGTSTCFVTFDTTGTWRCTGTGTSRSCRGKCNLEPTRRPSEAWNMSIQCLSSPCPCTVLEELQRVVPLWWLVERARAFGLVPARPGNGEMETHDHKQVQKTTRNSACFHH